MGNKDSSRGEKSGNGWTGDRAHGTLYIFPGWNKLKEKGGSNLVSHRDSFSGLPGTREKNFQETI